MKIPNHWRGSMEAHELAPRTFFLSAFSGVSVFETSEGLLLVDTGLPHLAPLIHAAIREKTKSPLHTLVITHGHVDHAFGLAPWLEEGSGKKPPRIAAHRAVLDRFARYERMRGLNEHVNRLQFSLDDVAWPHALAMPDLVYGDEGLEITIGGEPFELRHGRGETDDATWVWAPKRRTICTGDFWIGCAPNCGNPQKVQRYAEEWKGVLEAMAALKPTLLLPGHGPALVSEEPIRDALLDTARYLGSIVEQTLEGLNAGKRHEEIVANVRIPEDLADKPYLQPFYDRPEFIARNVIRLHAGWWDGFPATVLPAPPDARANEIANLAGGVDAIIARARVLSATDLPLACHLAEWAQLADPDHRGANEVVRDLFRARAEGEPSLMARSIFERAAGEADAKLTKLSLLANNANIG